jgi:hypothetical protein
VNTLDESREYSASERLRIDLELTNTCNFRCPICPHSLGLAGAVKGALPGRAPFHRKRGLMSRAVFERAVAECQRVASHVELGFFGEQTLHPQYLEFLGALHERRFALELNSNLSVVTRTTMQAWIDARVDLVRLSLDALDADVFDRARPGEVRGLDGEAIGERRRVDVLNEKVEWWLAHADHRPTRIVFVKSSHNQGELERFVAHWQPQLGAHDLVMAKKVLSYGGKMADPLQGNHRCNVWENRYLMIDWRGDLSPCNLDTNMDLVLGNVMEESIEAAYEGALARHLRGRTGCGNDLTPCRTCTDGNDWSGNEEFRALSFESAAAGGR